MSKENIFHVIKDPVHGTMQFTNPENNWIKPFIDSADFQRLRHIKQLGLGDFIFPGAVHTRFNHSLGCCYLASQIANKIGLAPEERQLVMIACLLHDIGHGPFSHAFEGIFQQHPIRHEAWTPYFLSAYRTESFFKNYNKHNPRQHLTAEKFSQIEDMIMHKSSIKPVLGDIVSSQLDADRLDYLLRDSHFCGVKYGEFDLRWMLNSLVIVESPHGERLGLTHKGIGVVEHYLMARRLMTRNIYHHQKKLALEFFLIKLLANLSENLDRIEEYHSIKISRLGQFLLAVNQFNNTHCDLNNVATLKQNFLETNYNNYKELCDYDVFHCIKTLAQFTIDQTAANIARRLQFRQMPKIIRLDHLELGEVEKFVIDFKENHKKDIEDWQFALIKTPHQAYSLAADPILISNEHRAIRSLDETSLMINAISDQKEQTAFLCIDRTIYDLPRVQAVLNKLFAKASVSA